jgi:hypothetical protein
MPHLNVLGGRLKANDKLNYAIIVIYCKTNQNLRFIDFTTKNNIRNYKYIILTKKCKDPKYSNMLLFKTINDNGGLTNWNIDIIEEMNCDRFEVNRRKDELSKKFGIPSNLYENTLINDIIIELKQEKQQDTETEDTDIEQETNDNYVCECGAKFKLKNLRHHIKTNKHIQFIKNKEQNICPKIENQNVEPIPIEIVVN